MRVQRLRNIVFSGLAATALTACGGGGADMAINGIPSPQVTPTPVPTPSSTSPAYIVAATAPDQSFASKGGTNRLDLAKGDALGTSIADGEQLAVRYNTASKQYEVRLPASATWQGIHLNPNQVPNDRDFQTSGSDAYVQLQQFAGTGYVYSALAQWSHPSSGEFGAVAFGIPTAAGGVPTAGTATYSGSIAGRTTERSFDYLAASYWPASVEGSINLSFSFGAGTLSGSLSPTIYNIDRHSLPTLTFVNTVYSNGSTTFSGMFDTSLQGTNSLSGLFTGPRAQELIGSFAFPYTSPEDGKLYQAAGGFVAR